MKRAVCRWSAEGDGGEKGGVCNGVIVIGL